MYSLRKYTLAICLVEALAIVVFVYLLMRPPGDLDQQAREASGEVLINSAGRTYFVSGPRSIEFFVDLVPDCNQRRHDLQTGDRKCESRQRSPCPSRELILFQANHLGPADAVARVITSSKAGDRWVRRDEPLKRVHCKSDDQRQTCRLKTVLGIDLKHEQQVIIGWGGAMTDSSINNILSLTTNGTRLLLDDYFGSNGLKFNIIRITIGGSDFSSRFYTNDDTYRNEPDLELKHFRLVEEDSLYKIPLLKHIQDQYGPNMAGGQLKLFASMWSPPVWMKTNRHFNKGFLRGEINDKPVLMSKPATEELYFNALADLKVRFIRAYQNESVKFWGLTVMNEPFFAVQPFLDFNTMIFRPEDYANYVAKYLGPKIKENKDLKHIVLMVHDDNRRFLENFTLPMLESSRVRRLVDGISVHGYADEAYNQMDKAYKQFQAPGSGFFVLPTELCSGHLPWMEKALVGNWHRGVHYALDIIRSLQHSAAGWVDWNMALDTTGGPGWFGGRLDAPIIVDKARDEYHKSPMYYVLGHFSRYIPPGSIKLQTTIFNDHFDYHFETVTFALPDREKLVTVVLNNNPYAIELNLRLVHQADYVYPLLCDANSISTLIYSRRLGQ